MFTINSHLVACISRGSDVVLEFHGSGVSQVLVCYTGEDLVVLVRSRLGSSAWGCSSGAIQSCQNRYVAGVERRWKVGSGNVEDGFVDPAYGRCCATGVAYVVDELKYEGAVALECGCNPSRADISAHFP